MTDKDMFGATHRLWKARAPGTEGNPLTRLSLDVAATVVWKHVASTAGGEYGEKAAETVACVIRGAIIAGAVLEVERVVAAATRTHRAGAERKMTALD